MVLLLATGILPEKEPVHFHFMHNVKAAEPESIRQPAQRAPAPNRPRLESLACINSKKWDKGEPQRDFRFCLVGQTGKSMG